MLKELINCDCSSIEHSCLLQYFGKNDDGTLDYEIIYIQYPVLSEERWFKRLFNIFFSKEKTGTYIIINEEEYSKIDNYLNHIVQDNSFVIPIIKIDIKIALIRDKEIDYDLVLEKDHDGIFTMYSKIKESLSFCDKIKMYFQYLFNYRQTICFSLNLKNFIKLCQFVRNCEDEK